MFEILGRDIDGLASSAYVMAGLDPAIHPFRKRHLVKIDGYAGQARV
jgi:hypothetical protein